jgi:hypothetical protein
MGSLGLTCDQVKIYFPVGTTAIITGRLYKKEPNKTRKIILLGITY